MKLDQLQHLFSDALLYKNDLVSQEIQEKSSFSSTELLQVYRNNFIMGTSEALAASYPQVLALVGEEFFNAAARQFILQQPPQKNNIMVYGNGFNNFLESLPQLQAMPYISEMARFEWLLEETSNAHIVGDSLDTTMLRNISPNKQSDISFHLPEHLRLFSSTQDIFQLYQMLINQEVEETDLNRRCYIALKKQPDFSVELIPLTANEYALAKQIGEKHTLGQIQPLELHQHLATLMKKRLLSGFSLLAD